MSDGSAAPIREERRLAMVFCDLVGSTELSSRLEPEPYGELMFRYKQTCNDVVKGRFDGYVVHVKGDGVLSIFGFPTAHENDTERAVRAGLALVQAIRELQPPDGTGDRLAVRVGIHAGMVLLEHGDVDVHGWAANLAARYGQLAEPGTVVVSDAVRRHVEPRFAFAAMAPQDAKGVDEPLQPFRVLGERRLPMPRRWSTPLVERDAELARLREAWAGVAAAAAGVLVRGEAGLGKSRLVCGFAEELRERDVQVIELHGSDIHAGAGLHPVRTLIEQRCGIGGDDSGSERLARLATELSGLGLDPGALLPLLAPVLGIAPSAGYEQAAVEGELLEQQVGDAVREYFAACLGDGPALVVAENLHWFDEASLELVRALARRRAAGALVVATSREPTPGPWETIELRPLTEAGRLALVEALDARLPARERLALSERSAGVPLYLEELVHAGPGREAAPVGPVPGSVPDALYEPLMARLSATPAALEVASTAAIAGPQVDRSLLAATAGKPAAEVDAALRALVDAQVLVPVAGAPARFRFRHELLRDVAYGLPPKSKRRELHMRMSDVLAAEQPDDWHLLAYHGERGGRYGAAADAYQRISELARRRGALEEAAGHLTRALELLRREPRDAARDHSEVGLLLRRAFLVMSKEGAAANSVAEDYERCRELAAADPRGDDMFSTLIAVWVYDLSLAELDQARQISETLRRSIGDGRGYFSPENRAGFGMLDWFAGRFDSARATLAEAVGELAENGLRDEVSGVWFVPNDPFVAMHTHLALAHFMAGDPAAAAGSLDRAWADAATLDFPQGPWSAAYAAWLGSWMWIEAGELEAAKGLVDEFEAICDRHGFMAWGLVAGTQAAALDAVRMLRSGDTDASALEDQADALGSLADLWEETGLRVFLPFYLTTTGALLEAAGDEAGARARFDESLALAAATGMTFYDAETQRLLARLAPDGAARAAALRGALELAREQGARPFVQRIERDLAGMAAAASRERAAR